MCAIIDLKFLSLSIYILEILIDSNAAFLSALEFSGPTVRLPSN